MSPTGSDTENWPLTPSETIAQTIAHPSGRSPQTVGDPPQTWRPAPNWCWRWRTRLK